MGRAGPVAHQRKQELTTLAKFCGAGELFSLRNSCDSATKQMRCVTLTPNTLRSETLWGATTQAEVARVTLLYCIGHDSRALFCGSGATVAGQRQRRTSWANI